MLKIEKTVFISYRRTNLYMARAVYENLARHEYDVFLDYESINAGDFEQIILNSIASRAHFILILTPSALERCTEPTDILRREIEHAILHKRNIIPLTFEGFDFAEMTRHLPESLAQPLSRYNGLPVPSAYFDEAMTRLRDRFLNVPLKMLIHPATAQTQHYEDQQKVSAEAAQPVAEKQLSAEEYFERALRHYNLRNYDAAISDYSQAIQLNSHYAAAYNNRGAAYTDKNDHAAAIHDYTRAIELDPKYAAAYYNRGLAYRAAKQHDLAIHDYTRAIELDPNDSAAYNSRGSAYRDKGEYDAAIRDCTAAIELNPNSAVAYNSRGYTFYRKGNFGEAIQDFDRAIELDPQFAAAYHNRGNARYVKEVYTLRQGDSMHNLRKDHLQSSDFSEDLEENEQAMRDYTRAIELAPLFVSAYISRGVAYMDKKAYSMAIRDFTHALQLDPQHVDAYVGRGTAYLNKKEYDAAINDYERALQIDPNYEFARENLALACKKKGR